MIFVVIPVFGLLSLYWKPRSLPPHALPVWPVATWFPCRQRYENEMAVQRLQQAYIVHESSGRPNRLQMSVLAVDESIGTVGCGDGFREPICHQLVRECPW